MALLTTAEVREITGLSNASDALLVKLTTRADALLAKHCGYPPSTAAGTSTFEQATYTAYSGSRQVEPDPENSREMGLEPWPVTSITSIHEDPEEDFTAASLVDSGDYTQRGTRGQIIRLKPSSSHGAWSQTEGVIKVVFVAGYTDGNAPDDLKAAAAEMVAHLHELKKRRGKRSISNQGLVTSYREETIPDHVREAIADYILPSVYL